MTIDTNNTTDGKNIEKTEVLDGVDNVIHAELQFFSNSKKRIDTCMNYTRPSLAIVLEPIKKAFLHARTRGVRLRYITEITHDNISACKELMTIVDELRHLDGIKGNFMVSETEYLAPVVLFEKGKIASQIIYSNVRKILDQHQYIFDTLWNKATSAQQRIREIEEGTASYETKVLEEHEEKIKKFKRYLENSNQLSVCTQVNRIQFVYNNFFDVIGKILDKSKSNNGEHKGIRWLTSIMDKDSANLVKIFLDSGVIIRHINQISMSFGVSDKEVAGSIANTEGTEMAKTLFVSNEQLYVKHFNCLFEELWKNGMDANDRIREIEDEVDQSNIEIIHNPEESIKRSYEIIKSAKDEVLRIFSSLNAFRRQLRIGIMHLFKEMVEKHGIKVRILLPAADQQQITQIVNEETVTLGLYLSNQIDIRSIDKNVQTSIGILVVDRKESLIIETKDDTKDNAYDAAGLAVYSNSKPIALSYASIFESLWKQSELYEQLKIHDKMQKEFINIAAHELRTPIQPILGLSQILRLKLKNTEYVDYLDSIVRNAKRLQRLTEDILDVQKIEGRLLQLNKERFNLNDLISNIVEDYKNQLEKENGNLKLFQQLNVANPILLEADKNRIFQVLSNLLSNTVKFTKDGTILVDVEHDRKNKEVIVSIRDSGTGVDADIMPRLFSKFATKSYHGTGLGLFISKGIIEAHGGRMWAENNSDGEKGATFHFSLPLSS